MRKLWGAVAILVLSLLAPGLAQPAVARNSAPLATGLSQPLPAPQDSAVLSGTVTDSMGAALPNAKVFLENLTTKQTVATQTAENGHYEFVELVPGNYLLTVSAQNFANASMEIMISIGARETQDCKLQSVAPLT